MNLISYPSRRAASEAAAELLASAVQQQLALSERTTLVVSGGSTPLECFAILRQMPVAWQSVDVSLTDERCVPTDHEDSNEGMLRRHLLRDNASQARYVSPEEVGAEPFSAVLVGMGSDGHFASLFPDADNLAHGLDLQNAESTLPVNTAASPHPRISMTLSRLVNSELIVLLAFGDDKRAVLDNPAGFPVAHLLGQQRADVKVVWAA